MTFTALETSLQQGAPIEYYLFVQGLKRWAYCTGNTVRTYLGDTYVPYPVVRPGFSQTTKTARGVLRLSFPANNEFASQFLGFAPDVVTSVTIFRAHATDPDGQLSTEWKGRVITGKTSGSTIDLECEQVYSSTLRNGLRARFEINCRHALYRRGCNVSRELYLLSGSVISISGLNIDVSGAGSLGASYFVGGILAQLGGGERFITAQAGSVLTINRPFAGLQTGAAVNLYPGCDHLRST